MNGLLKTFSVQNKDFKEMEKLFKEMFSDYRRFNEDKDTQNIFGEAQKDFFFLT